MNYLSIDEIHKEEVKILKKFISFCDENNLTYYICGGTLLGAIRHKGFIPWDDDIDVMMPRKEFEKLEKLLNEKNFDKNLNFISYDNNSLPYPFGKVINTNIKIDETCSKNEYEQFLWIDIFPMDGIPEDTRECEKFYKKILRYRKLLLILYAEDNYIDNFSKTCLKRIFKKIIRVLFRKNYKEKIASKLDKMVKTYDFEDSKYVGGVAWGYGPQEKMLKENIKNCEVDFEKMKVNTISCYETYLTNLYGDYMKLPPVEKRITHEMKVYRIGEDDYE